MKKYKNKKEFLKARDEALISGDVEQMRLHLIRSGNDDARKARPEIITVSIHKARVHWRNCPADLLKESVWWLFDHGFHLDL